MPGSPSPASHMAVYPHSRVSVWLEVCRATWFFNVEFPFILGPHFGLLLTTPPLELESCPRETPRNADPIWFELLDHGMKIHSPAWSVPSSQWKMVLQRPGGASMAWLCCRDNACLNGEHSRLTVAQTLWLLKILIIIFSDTKHSKCFLFGFQKNPLGSSLGKPDDCAWPLLSMERKKQNYLYQVVPWASQVCYGMCMLIHT